MISRDSLVDKFYDTSKLLGLDPSEDELEAVRNLTDEEVPDMMMMLINSLLAVAHSQRSTLMKNNL